MVIVQPKHVAILFKSYVNLNEACWNLSQWPCAALAVRESTNRAGATEVRTWSQFFQWFPARLQQTDFIELSKGNRISYHRTEFEKSFMRMYGNSSAFAHWGEIELFSATLAQNGLADCDQPRKNPLKYSATSGNWTRAKERTDSEIH